MLPWLEGLLLCAVRSRKPGLRTDLNLKGRQSATWIQGATYVVTRARADGGGVGKERPACATTVVVTH